MNNRSEFTAGIIQRDTICPEITPPRNHSFNINLMIHGRTEVFPRAGRFAEEDPEYGRIFGGGGTRVFSLLSLSLFPFRRRVRTATHPFSSPRSITTRRTLCTKSSWESHHHRGFSYTNATTASRHPDSFASHRLTYRERASLPCARFPRVINIRFRMTTDISFRRSHRA